MGIQKDAGEVLGYVYERYAHDESGEFLGPEDFINETKWEASKINHAITYLRDLGLIKIKLLVGNTEDVYNFIMMGMTPQGIDMIENKGKFKSVFGFEIGFPKGISFSWRGERK